MELLLDTHTVLWFLNGDEKLSDKAKTLIEDYENIKLVSVASLWEIAIKLSLGKINYPKGLKNLFKMIEDNGFTIHQITPAHVIAVSDLPFFHRDPFDRILISQAVTDDLVIVTKDENIGLYNVKTLW